MQTLSDIERDRWRPALEFLLVAALIGIPTVSPITANDYFWHLAAGAWITDHGELPSSDPLAVASSSKRWINGEWLFQVVLYAVYRAVGHSGIALLRAALLGVVFAALYMRVSRATSRFTALCLVWSSWYLSRPFLTERPSTFGVVFLAVLLVMLQDLTGVRRRVAIFFLVVLWMNVHPSALLAPLVVVAWEIGERIEQRDLTIRRISEALFEGLAPAAALLLNPFTVAGVLQPLHVANVARSPLFDNEEWQATNFGEYPLFGVALVVVAVVFLASHRRRHWLPTIVLSIGFALLAILVVRNLPVFYLTVPLLLLPHLRTIPSRFSRALSLPVAITIAAVMAGSNISVGIEQTKFPVAATAAVKELRLNGNVLSPYGMGGYLIWEFAPERRVLTDGRNELFVEYQTRWSRSGRSSELWNRFVNDHEVGVAYVPIISDRRFVRDATTGARTLKESWDIYFPAVDWALVAIDEAALVFANRRLSRIDREIRRP